MVKNLPSNEIEKESTVQDKCDLRHCRTPCGSCHTEVCVGARCAIDHFLHDKMTFTYELKIQHTNQPLRLVDLKIDVCVHGFLARFVCCNLFRSCQIICVCPVFWVLLCLSKSPRFTFGLLLFMLLHRISVTLAFLNETENEGSGEFTFPLSDGTSLPFLSSLSHCSSQTR